MWAGIAVRRAERAAEEGARRLADGDLDAAGRAYATALAKVRRRAVAGHPVAARAAATAHVGLGRVCLARDDPQAADPEFLAVQQLLPNEWIGYFWTGCAAAHLSDFPRADWHFGAALQRGPDVGRAYLQRAYVRLRSGRQDDALADFDAAGRCGALDDGALVVLAGLWQHRRAWDRVEVVLSAIAPERRSATAHAMLGLATERQQKYAQSMVAYDAAVRGGERNSSVLFHRGLVAYRLGLYSDCARSWTQLCEAHPQGGRYTRLVARAHYASAHSLVTSGDVTPAVERLRAGVDAQPPGSLDDALRGVELYAAVEAAGQGDEPGRERAGVLLASALDRAPEDPTIRYYLALLDHLDGHTMMALHEWTNLLRETPDDERLRYALAVSSAQLRDTPVPRAELADLAAHASAAVAARSRRALAALHVRHGEWAEATGVLAQLPDGDPLRHSLLPESAHRSPEGTAGRAERLGPWRAAAEAAQGDPAAALNALAGGVVPERLRRELALLVRRAALDEVGQRRWDVAANLLVSAAVPIGESTDDLLFHGTVRVLGGSRAAGIDLLADAARRAPRDHRLIHTLALALLHTLSSPDARPSDAVSWARCIGVLVALLHDEVFWADLLADAERRYEAPVPADVVESLRAALRELVGKRLPADVDADGWAPEMLLRRETTAAEVLAVGGGFPLPPEFGVDAFLICGPLWIAELDLTDDFGDFMAEAVEEIGADIADLAALSTPGAADQIATLRAIRERLLRCFSRLGVAHCMLVAEQSEEALAEVADLRCPDCRAANPTPPRSAQTLLPLVCAPGCPRFERDNPAYAGFADGRAELASDGAVLAVDALLALGQTALTAAEPDLDAVTRHWGLAVSGAAELGARAEVQERVTDLTMGRADVLAQRRKLTDAIGVLRAGRRVLSTDGRERVDGLLANQLANRGIKTANDDIADVGLAIDDLSEALALNPYLMRARTSLGILTRHRALKRLEAGAPVEALRLLQEVVDLMTEGLAANPGHHELVELRDACTSDHNSLTSALISARAANRRR
jgi:tetratricopeptide (TPR) repeat protein